MVKYVRKNDIKDSKYYSYKPVGLVFNERLYEETFNSKLYESDQQNIQKRQLIIDRVEHNTINDNIPYDKIINLTPKEIVTYSVRSNYDDKSLTVLGSDSSSTTVNWKYDIINWFVKEDTLTFREVDRSTNEQYDRTFNIPTGKVEGSRRVMIEERFEQFVNKSIDTDSERGPVGLGNYGGASIQDEGPCTILKRLISLKKFKNWSPGTTPTAPIYSEPGTGSSPGEGFNRLKACLRGIAILVNSKGEITCSAVTGATTNNLDLENLLTNSRLVPSEAGSYTFVFEFFGWRRNGTHENGIGWESADDKYNVFEDFQEDLEYTTTHTH